MRTPDAFVDFAPYYDPIMKEIDYDRWLVVASYLADLIPRHGFRHVDVGCGTGVLTKRLLQHGWRSVGVDLSFPMLRTARNTGVEPVVAAADMRALPFRGTFDYATCVFDSLNFMLTPEDLGRAARAIADVLADDGLFYFDTITERMVLDHFADRRWTEDNGRFTTTWEGRYDPKSRVADTHIQVHYGPATLVRERAHSMDEIEAALRAAGFRMLGAYDAENWRKPTKKTVRIDVVATKSDSKALRKKFRDVRAKIADVLA